MSSSKFLEIGLVAILLIVTVLAVRVRLPKPAVNHNHNAIRYLPLGDSYTIGESVAKTDRWPNQLVARISNNGPQMEIVANPSMTGYTTHNLIDRELPLVTKLKPDFVTIQIGVNDYVQKVGEATFSQNLEYIISNVQKQLRKPGNMVLVTIPDYGKTPTGAHFGSPLSSEAGVIAFNKIIAGAAAKYKLPVADIFTISQKVAGDPSLLANDGLHPSAKQYSEWTDVIYQTLRENKLP